MTLALSEPVTLTVNEKGRFWAKVRKTESCWFWTAAQGRGGCGVFRVGRQLKYAHRIVHALATGTNPRVVIHTCQQPSCVRPEHLVSGDYFDAARQREDRGTKRPTKLTADDVRAIRATYALGQIDQSTLAQRFGVSKSTVSRVTRRASWRIVD